MKLVNASQRITLDNTLDERLRLLEDRVSYLEFDRDGLLIFCRCFPRLGPSCLERTTIVNFIHDGHAFAFECIMNTSFSFKTQPSSRKGLKRRKIEPNDFTSWWCKVCHRYLWVSNIRESTQWFKTIEEIWRVPSPLYCHRSMVPKARVQLLDYWVCSIPSVGRVFQFPLTSFTGNDHDVVRSLLNRLHAFWSGFCSNCKHCHRNIFQAKLFTFANSLRSRISMVPWSRLRRALFFSMRLAFWDRIRIQWNSFLANQRQ